MIRRQDSIIITTLTRLLTPFIQLFGLYVIIHGHSSPGGGFQGGVILGASFILLAISFGIDEAKQRFSEGVVAVLTSGGVFLFAGAVATLFAFVTVNLFSQAMASLDFAAAWRPRSENSLGAQNSNWVRILITHSSLIVSSPTATGSSKLAYSSSSTVRRLVRGHQLTPPVTAQTRSVPETRLMAWVGHTLAHR